MDRWMDGGTADGKLSIRWKSAKGNQRQEILESHDRPCFLNDVAHRRMRRRTLPLNTYLFHYDAAKDLD